MHALFAHVKLEIQLRVLDEGPELRLIVEDVVVSMLLNNPGVISRNGRIINTDLALVPSPHPDSLCRDVLDAYHGRVLHLDFFQDQMLSFGELDGHQFKHLIPLLDKLRVFLLTDFAEKLLKVVVSEPFDLVLLDLSLVPLFQAGEVDQGTGA